MKNFLINYKFHHVGYATKSIAETLKKFELLGYTAGKSIRDERQNVNVIFLEKTGSPIIELVESTTLESPVNNILKKNGVIPYHICFEVKDIHEAITDLRKQGFILVFDPIPAEAFKGRNICYLYDRNFGLLELLEID